MVFLEAVEAGADALHQARWHTGDWRTTDCGCAADAQRVVQAAAAVLGDYMERQRAVLEGRPPRPVSGAPAPPPKGEPPPRPRWAPRDGPDRSRRRR